MPCQVALHRTQANAQAAGRTRAIAAFDLQDRLDHLLKDVAELLVEADLKLIARPRTIARAAVADRVLLEGYRQVLQAYRPCAAKQADELEHVSQLANIAGPTVAAQGGGGRSRHLWWTHAVLRRKFRNELEYQRSNISWPV